MKVVLLKSVDNLGTAGEAVEVKRGYFRNYLEPRRMALVANKQNLAYVEAQAEKLKAVVARETTDAASVKERLETLDLHFQLRAGEMGRLFGSVTAREVLERIKEETGIEIERRKVEMDNLKTLGTHEVRVRVYPGVVAKVKATVERLVAPGEEALLEEEGSREEQPEEVHAAMGFFEAQAGDDDDE